MKHLQNERGAAFLLTLLATGVVLLFASFLLTHSQTANRQAHTTSDRLEARLMAEAGVDVYTERLKTAATLATDAVDVRIPDGFTLEPDASHGFTIHDVTSSLNGDTLTVTYTSTGKAGTKEDSITQQTTIAP